MKAHAFDPLSFVAGLVFAGIGIAAAAGGLDDLESLRVGWPLFLIGMGLLLVVSTIRPGQRTPVAVPVDEQPGDDEPSPFDPAELDEATPEA